MNSISGHIAHIESEGSFQLINIQAEDASFKSIIIQNGSEVYLKGDAVTMHFKETEVSIATKMIEEISLQNQIEGRIHDIESDNLLSRIVLETVHGHISSIITAASALRLGLKVGNKAVALVKTNEVMLSKR